MNKEINLLIADERKSVDKTLVQKIKILKISAATAVAILILSVGILYFLQNNSSLKQLTDQHDESMRVLSTISPKLTKYQYVQGRLTVISTIISQRFDVNGKLDSVNSQIPTSITISSFAINTSGIDINMSAPSLRDIDTTLGNFKKLVNTKQTLQQFTINSFQFDHTQQKYTLALHLQLL